MLLQQASPQLLQVLLLIELPHAKHPPPLLQVLLLDELTTFLDDEDQGGVLRAVRDVTSCDRHVTALWVSATAADAWMPRHSSLSMVCLSVLPSVSQNLADPDSAGPHKP